MTRQLYNMRLPEGVTKEDLHKRADELGVNVATILETGTRFMLETSPFFLKRMLQFSQMTKYSVPFIIERLVLYAEAERLAKDELFGGKTFINNMAMVKHISDTGESIEGEEILNSLKEGCKSKLKIYMQDRAGP